MSTSRTVVGTERRGTLAVYSLSSRGRLLAQSRSRICAPAEDRKAHVRYLSRNSNDIKRAPGLWRAFLPFFSAEWTNRCGASTSPTFRFSWIIARQFSDPFSLPPRQGWQGEPDHQTITRSTHTYLKMQLHVIVITQKRTEEREREE